MKKSAGNVALVSVGNELLTGHTLDSNAPWLSKILTGQGFTVSRHLTLGDDAREMKAVFRRLSKQCDLVIVTGGLGPTDDDITRECLAAVAKTKPVFNKKCWDNIEKIFAIHGRTPSENNRRQVMLPKGAIPFYNGHGTAPGLALHVGQAWFCLMPGVPSEMKMMTNESLVPFVTKYYHLPVQPLVKTFKLHGIGESDLAMKLGDMVERDRDPRVDITVDHSVITLKLICQPGKDQKKKQQVASRAIKKIAGEHLWATRETSLAEALVKKLIKNKLTIASAESCTGGLVSAALVGVSGASSVLAQGIVTYSNEAKQKLLGVKKSSLDGDGAVSFKVAGEMASGLQKRANVEIACSVTGIAGPNGGTKEKPVGTVYFAIKQRGQQVKTYHKHFRGEREQVRQRACNWILAQLIHAVE